MSENRAEMEARRRGIVDAIVERTGIDEAMIERLVHSFYGKVRDDPMLGPIFAARIRDWDAHLAKMCSFWSTVALMSGRYHGQPLISHLPLPVDERHFARWLELFDEAAQAECTPAAAAHFNDLARRIARSFEAGVLATQRELERVRG